MIPSPPLNRGPNWPTVAGPSAPPPAVVVRTGGPLAEPEAEPTSEVPTPAHLTRTSREMLGQRPLPRVLRERAVVYVLGPDGVGKTTVGRRLCGDERLEISGDQLRRATVGTARRGFFSAELTEAPVLLVDGLDYWYNRYGAVELVGRLLRARAAAGRRTVLTQGPADNSITELYGPVPLELRASLLLRFPVGKGRRTHVTERCRARGLDPSLAAEAVHLEPWTYAGVEAVLDRIQDALEQRRRRA